MGYCKLCSCVFAWSDSTDTCILCSKKKLQKQIRDLKEEAREYKDTIKAQGEQIEDMKKSKGKGGKDG